MLTSLPSPLRTILIFMSILTFLVDAYPTYAASAIAANAFARCAFAGTYYKQGDKNPKQR